MRTNLPGALRGGRVVHGQHWRRARSLRDLRFYVIRSDGKGGYRAA
jgi:hypothetical protein